MPKVKGDFRGNPDVVQVWEAWRQRQRRPELCLFTTDRAALIYKRLQMGYTSDALVALIRYAYEADTPEARWWRGENPRGTVYTDLKNLTWEEKIGGRVQRAMEWLADQTVRDAGVTVLDDHRDVNLGHIGRLAKFRGRGIRS